MRKMIPTTISAKVPIKDDAGIFRQLTEKVDLLDNQ